MEIYFADCAGLPAPLQPHPLLPAWPHDKLPERVISVPEQAASLLDGLSSYGS